MADAVGEPSSNIRSMLLTTDFSPSSALALPGLWRSGWERCFYLLNVIDNPPRPRLRCIVKNARAKAGTDGRLRGRPERSRASHHYPRERGIA